MGRLPGPGTSPPTLVLSSPRSLSRAQLRCGNPMLSARRRHHRPTRCAGSASMARTSTVSENSSLRASAPASCARRPPSPAVEAPASAARGFPRGMRHASRAGSMRYVHVSCLNDWRSSSSNPRSYYQCDQCEYKYSLQRTRAAAWLESRSLVRAFAALLLIVAFAASALILGGLHLERHFYRAVRFDPRDAIGPRWTDGCDRAAAGLLGVAGAGLCLSLRDTWQRNRRADAAASISTISECALDVVSAHGPRAHGAQACLKRVAARRGGGARLRRREGPPRLRTLRPHSLGASPRADTVLYPRASMLSAISRWA